MSSLSGYLKLTRKELNLLSCLKGGMSFRWNEINISNDECELCGVIGRRVYYLKQNYLKDFIEYKVYSFNKNLNSKKVEEKEINDELNDYFRLNINLTDLYKEWSMRDEKFKQKVERHSETLNGVRVLRLDPVENLFSFICSSNNNIKRITQMVNNLCIHFGEYLGSIDNESFYKFPTITRLAQQDVEIKLRELKFGYRAKYINEAAKYILKNFNDNNGEWLYSLRLREYKDVTSELVKIPGIGKKVSDCICLMSLDKLDAIPIDTHVMSIAINIYKFFEINTNKKNDEKVKKKNSQSLSQTMYYDIAKKFQDLWHIYPGWAQTVMFIGDFKQFQIDSTNHKIKDEKNTEDNNIDNNNKLINKKRPFFSDNNKTEPDINECKNRKRINLKK